MVNGEIHYARFQIDLDSNSIINDINVELITVFPTSNYDIINSQLVPISGGSGISKAVMVVIARRIT